jgi:ankyrin repeat protein
LYYLNFDLNQLGYSLLSIDETGKTALHYGARFGHKEIVKFLIGNAPSPILDMVDNEKGKCLKVSICCFSDDNFAYGYLIGQ